MEFMEATDWSKFFPLTLITKERGDVEIAKSVTGRMFRFATPL